MMTDEQANQLIMMAAHQPTLEEQRKQAEDMRNHIQYDEAELEDRKEAQFVELWQLNDKQWKSDVRNLATCFLMAGAGLILAILMMFAAHWH